MYKLKSNLSNRSEYRNCQSLYGADYIARNILANYPEVQSIELIATETGETIKRYERG